MSNVARLELYLSSLPGGMASYPECQAKGVLMRRLVAERAFAGAVLAPMFRQMVEDPPVASEWVPEVHLRALGYALADACGLDDDGIVAVSRERDRGMFESPTYRMLMAASSPGALVRGADLRWANWHRGSTLEVEGLADDGVRVAVRFPPGLFDRLHLRTIGEAFLAALDLSQAREPRAQLIEAGAGLARYRVEWGS